MKTRITSGLLIAFGFGTSLLGSGQPAHASAIGWSVVPYIGISHLVDQSGTFSGSSDILDGGFEVSLDSGFTGGLSVRYGYSDSRWTSEFGWEYRSNDSEITQSDSSVLPPGNFASNIFYLNGRYALMEGRQFIPWLGGGISLIQEIDLDSEDTGEEKSFSDSGAFGAQLMVGFDYALTRRLYLTGEVRYTEFTGLTMTEEGGNGEIADIDYTPVTLAVGMGFRF